MNIFDFAYRLEQHSIPKELVRLLVRKYTEKTRFYHTFAHIEQGFYQYELMMQESMNLELFLAWTYHDVIYKPKAKNNEEKSAELFKEHNEMIGCCGTLADDIVRRILTTTHKNENEKNILTDIDLAGLGADHNTYWMNNRRIRREYQYLTLDEWVAGRTSFIKQFLSRDSIFWNENFKKRYEKQAQKNLQNELIFLKSELDIMRMIDEKAKG